ncbi:MFS transporter [Hazenella sp. IB182353]|uniref:MFS transporter n=1 Tax=Polycladospora coralii TaxID=2771432 RepID=UPI001747A437|nr:MFS transporter [Polycladospora coralii]MBS7529624.1 MFS transporter [Polycladospora coralii]
MTAKWSLKRFYMILFIVCISGVVQGLLLPLVTTLQEKQGIPAGLNGLSAAILYMGILVMTPFCAPLVQKIGYKWLMVSGLIVTIIAVGLFPLLSGFWIWSCLRFFIGVGDSMFHYATQLWITATAPANERGKRISQYGFSFGLGFGLGPLGLNLLQWGTFVPYYVLLVILLFTLIVSLKLQFTQVSPTSYTEEKSSPVKLKHIYSLAFVALLPSFLYGVLEASLASSFPIYGIRMGLSTGWISLLITVFVWGALLFQIPLGTLGDKIGRKKLLIWLCTIGAIGMAMIPFFITNQVMLLLCFLITGGLLGSLFSQGLAFIIDVVPSHYLPKANAVSSIHFSMGSILGPYIGGMLIQWQGGASLFYFFAVLLIGFVLTSLFYRTASNAIEQMQASTK